MPTLHLLVKGKVQGVFYRATAKEIAERFSITGWIRNTKDGDVEVVASGSAESLQQFTSWCKQGPPAANVHDVLINEMEEKIFNKFAIERG